MGESSRRSKKRHSKRKERRSKPAATPLRSEEERTAKSPPSYSVEENSEGEWVNSRLNVKWPEQVRNYDVSKHRYLTLADPPSDRGSERRSRKKRSKKEKRDRKKRDQSKRSSRASARSPYSSAAEKDSQYITLSIGSEKEDSSDRSKRVRRERKRMVVQTSPQVSKKSRKSRNGGFTTDEDGKKIDSVVFDTRSEMMRYKKSDDILPTKRRANRSKKPSVADRSENAEYNRYYVGVKSRRSVENLLKRPGEFALYYEKPRDYELPDRVNLKIAYFSSGSQEYFHFPIQCFAGPDGHDHYIVMQTKSDGKMFTSVLQLVKHYSLYSHVDTSTGRLETFSVPH